MCRPERGIFNCKWCVCVLAGCFCLIPSLPLKKRDWLSPIEKGDLCPRRGAGVTKKIIVFSGSN